MGTKIGAWMTRTPFYKGGKLPIAIRKYLLACLGLFLFLGLSAFLGLPSRSAIQQERATHAGLAYAGQEAANTWYFLLHLDLGQESQMTVTLTNLETQKVQVNLSAYDEDGGFLRASTTSVEAQAGQTIELEKVLPLESETLKLESRGNLVAASLFKTLDGKKSEAIPAIQDTSQQLNFPPLLQGDQADKAITLLNIESAFANLEVIALDQAGGELERILLPPLSPMASHTFAVRDLFSAGSLQQLSTVRVTSDRDIVGRQLVDPPNGDLVGLPALTMASREWLFPIVTKSGDLELWTAVGLFNPGDGSTSVTVEAFDNANNSLGIVDSAPLLPGATHFVITANMMGLIPLNAASLKVTSDQPITGYEVIGVINGNGLTATLGIPEEDQTTAGLELTGSQDGSVLSAYPMMRMRDGSIKSTAGRLGSGEWRESVRVPGKDAKDGTQDDSVDLTSITAQKRLATQQTAATAPVVTSMTPNSGVAGTQSAGPISLIFPVRISGQNTPWTAPISSVFDHSMQRPYGDSSYNGYGKVTAFTGEEGSGARDLCPGSGACRCLYGYINPTKDVFIVNGTYSGGRSCGGGSYLEYDNHPGIDYAFGYGTALYPAIRGKVHYFNPPWPTGNARRFNTLQIDPEDGSGYKVYYLHLSTYPDPNDSSGKKILRRVKNADGTYTVTECKECAKENEWVDVNRSNPIAYTGDYLGVWGGVRPHLHFEVQRNDRPVDPYGWDVVGMRDPYDTIQGTNGINVLLWRDPRLNAQGGIDQRPIARFTMTASNGQTANENTTLSLTVPPGGTIGVTFNPSRSSDPDGIIKTYRWYVNGELQPQSQPRTSTFSRSFTVGTYSIFLVVQDEKGATGAVEASIVVTEASGFRASGRVTTSSGTGISGVTLTFTWVSGTGTIPAPVSTDANGYWSQSGFQTGTTYRVTPSKSGYTFTPTSRNFGSASTGLNFTGTATTGGCTVTPISMGQTVNGALSTGDCRSPVRGSSYYADRYSFSASAGQQVAILLTSSAFDTYLYLIGPSGSVLAQDDDGGGGTNSRIPAGSGFYSLPSSGTYIIEVTSYAANATGTYTLSLSTNSNTVIFQDNMESGVGSWFAQSPWALTTSTAYSPTHSWTDSPGGNYSNNANVSLWSPFLNFSGLSSVTLTFWHRYDLESNHDFGSVWITTDNGGTYTRVASFTGTNNTWTQATVDLSAFAGRPSVRIAFQLFSDGSITRDGWYIDDVLVTGR